MKKIMMLTALFMAGMAANALSQAEAETALLRIAMDSTSHSTNGKMTMRPGKQIRRTVIKGYTLTYHLLELSERGEMMKLMGSHSVIGMSKSHDVTNHLMVYIRKPDGKTAPGDVAFLLKGPDGKEFRTMTMGMYGGYGADVILKLKGAYTVRTKIVLEGRGAVKLDDEFTFQVN